MRNKYQEKRTKVNENIKKLQDEEIKKKTTMKHEN